jgi:hypothetical protein
LRVSRPERGANSRPATVPRAVPKTTPPIKVPVRFFDIFCLFIAKPIVNGVVEAVLIRFLVFGCFVFSGFFWFCWFAARGFE